MQQTILEYLKEQFHLSFTQQQLQAIETIDGPVLLLAVPRSGQDDGDGKPDCQHDL